MRSRLSISGYQWTFKSRFEVGHFPSNPYVCVGAGTTVNSLTGASRRSKAQFMLMDYFPGTLQAFIAAWHGRRTPVPYKQAVAILAGVRVFCVSVFTPS